MERFNFIDDDLISVESILDKDKIKPVSDEVSRGGTIYNERITKKLKRKEIKPLYDEARRKKQETSKIAVYKLYCTFPKPLSPYTTEYPKCEHKGNIIIDRDVLPKEEHIELLALPKIRPVPPQVKKRRCHFEKKFLPNCTAHIENLAIPSKRKVMITLQTFGGVLSPKKIDHLCGLLNRDKKDFRSIENAVQLRREECKRKLAAKQRILHKAGQIKRKLKKLQTSEVMDIVTTIYEVMKTFLMTDHNQNLNKGLRNLSSVLQLKIKTFLGMPEPCELESRFIKVLADNLALWMEKFLSNFGFECLCEKPQPPTSKTCPCIEKELLSQIPIDDYIELTEEEELKPELEVEEEADEAQSDMYPSSAIEEIFFESEFEEGALLEEFEEE